MAGPGARGRARPRGGPAGACGAETARGLRDWRVGRSRACCGPGGRDGGLARGPARLGDEGLALAHVPARRARRWRRRGPVARVRVCVWRGSPVCGGAQGRQLLGRRVLEALASLPARKGCRPTAVPPAGRVRAAVALCWRDKDPCLSVGITLRALGTCYCAQLVVSPGFRHLPCKFFFSSPTHTAEILWASRKPLQGWKGSAAAGVGDSFYLGLPRPNSAPPTWASLLGAGLQAPRPPPPFQPLLLRGVWSLSFENSKWRLS